MYSILSMQMLDLQSCFIALLSLLELTSMYDILSYNSNNTHFSISNVTRHYVAFKSSVLFYTFYKSLIFVF